MLILLVTSHTVTTFGIFYSDKPLAPGMNSCQIDNALHGSSTCPYLLWLNLLEFYVWLFKILAAWSIRKHITVLLCFLMRESLHRIWILRLARLTVTQLGLISPGIQEVCWFGRRLSVQDLGFSSKKSFIFMFIQIICCLLYTSDAADEAGMV